MGRLHAGRDAQRPQTRHIRPVDQLNMLNPMPAVTFAVALLRRFIAVDRLAHRRIADGMHRNLQPPPDFGGTIRTDYVRGLAMVEEKMVILLDVDYLVASDVAMIDAEEPAEIAESLAE
jgi:hypothetical protein